MKILRKIVGLISLVIFIGMLAMPMGVFVTSLSPRLKVTLERTGMHFLHIGIWISLISLAYLVFWGLIKPARVRSTVKILRKIIGVVSLGSIVIIVISGFVPGFALVKLTIPILFGVPLYLVYWGFKR